MAGLVIGLLASVFLLRRRRKPDPEPRAVESRPGERRRDSRALTATPVEPVTAVSGLEQFLAIPKSDKELSGELQSLGYLIQQHVEDNYHLLPVGQDTDSLSQALEDLGLDDCRSALPKTDWLAAMVVDPRTRLVALQHVIARVIFGSLSVEPMGKMSMLPPSVSSLVRSMPPCEKHMGSPEGIVRATFSVDADTVVLTTHQLFPLPSRAGVRSRPFCSTRVAVSGVSSSPRIHH